MIPSIIVPVTYHEVINAFKTITIDDGSQISSFEEKISEYIDCSEILLTYSGRTALYLLLKAYGLKRNDEVIMPAYDCETVARLIIDMGYNLRFADVDKNTYNMSVEDLGERITDNTKAVIAIHMFGNPCDMDGIMEVASDHGAVVIEDSAQTIGAEYNCRKTGTVGDCGFFSFGTAKPMTTMNGGLLIAKNERVMEKVRMIAGGFRSSNRQRLKVAVKLAAYSVIKNPLIYDPIYKFILNRRITRRCALEKEGMNPDDFNYAYTDMQAAVGMMQLSKLNMMNNIRVANTNLIMKRLSSMKTIHLPMVLGNAKPIFLRLPIRIEWESMKVRDELIQRMQRAGIDTPVAYPNVLPRFCNSGRGKYPNAEELVEKTITLPVHPLIKDSDIERMVGTIKEFVEEYP